MKNQTVGIAMYIAIGLAVIGIAIIILFPIIQDILRDADSTKPTIPTTPTTYIEQQAPDYYGINHSDLA